MASPAMDSPANLDNKPIDQLVDLVKVLVEEMDLLEYDLAVRQDKLRAVHDAMSQRLLNPSITELERRKLEASLANILWNRQYSAATEPERRRLLAEKAGVLLASARNPRNISKELVVRTLSRPCLRCATRYDLEEYGALLGASCDRGKGGAAGRQRALSKLAEEVNGKHTASRDPPRR